MDKHHVKLLAIGFGIGFTIFVGMGLANRSMDRIEQPTVSESIQQTEPGHTAANMQTRSEPDAALVSEASREPDAKGKWEMHTLEAESRASISSATGMSRVGNKIGALLQIVAYYGIQCFVGLFEPGAA